jgi:hypothetical protein
MMADFTTCCKINSALRTEPVSGARELVQKLLIEELF